MKPILSLDGTIHDEGEVISVFTPFKSQSQWKVGDVAPVVDRTGRILGTATCRGIFRDYWANGKARKITEFKVLTVRSNHD